MEQKDKEKEHISKNFSKALLLLAIGAVFFSLPEFINVNYDCLFGPCYMEDPLIIANIKITFRVISLLFFTKGFQHMKKYHQEMKKFLEAENNKTNA
jgi:hypothetical protein